MNNIYCMLLGKGRVTPRLRNYLFDAAQSMLRNNIPKNVVRGDFSGIITTDGSHASVGLVSGQVFHARMEYADGEIDLTYLVRRTDTQAEEGSWYGPDGKPTSDPFNL